MKKCNNFTKILLIKCLSMREYIDTTKNGDITSKYNDMIECTYFVILYVEDELHEEEEDLVGDLDDIIFSEFIVEKNNPNNA